MSSPLSPEKLAANIANAQLSTGPRTESGQAISAKNALKSGLFATQDFIRPGEERPYASLDEALHAELTPSGQLEHNLVDEIRRAMWRLRRCGQLEATLVHACAETCPESATAPELIPDPMQNEATAKLQNSVDRARAQCHCLLHRCTAELRKLQTERHTRNETSEAGADLSPFGICDLGAVRKSIEQQAVTDQKQHQREKVLYAAALKDQRDQLKHAFGVQAGEPVTKQTHPSRNSRCACGSGLKYKRCCGREAAPVIHTASLPKAA